MTALVKPHEATALENVSGLGKLYMETLSLIERLHRQLLDVIKDELDRRDEREINGVQALLLFNIGDQELTAGELRSRGHYLGSNVSYNVKKLSDSGYLVYERSVHDRRSIRIRLTPKGRSLRDRLSGMLDRHIEMLGETQIKDIDLERTATTLQRLERFWMPSNGT